MTSKDGSSMLPPILISCDSTIWDVGQKGYPKNPGLVTVTAKMIKTVVLRVLTHCQALLFRTWVEPPEFSLGSGTSAG